MNSLNVISRAASLVLCATLVEIQRRIEAYYASHQP